MGSAEVKKLPVGIESFEEIRTEGFYYVDKTWMIKELLDRRSKVDLFTRPRRFGKSLNMSMLKAFFEIGCDKTLFEGLKISKEKALCQRYMGSSPVVSITLKSIDGLGYQEAHAALRRVVGREALRFPFLAESSRLLDSEKEMYKALTKVEEGSFAMSDDVLIDSIRTLSQLLSRHYGRKTIILIDEYDVPLDKAFQAGYYDEMVFLIRNLFSNALKTNEYLDFAVLTGCLRISKESIFTGLNNFRTYTITDTRYDGCFGFTDADVQEMLAYYGLTDQADRIREWYDGYRSGNTSVYCPWDVINHCDALSCDRGAMPENYWANTSGNTMVKRFIGKADRQTRSEIEQLIDGGSIIKTVNQELTYGEIDDSIENLWSVLLATGYLTWQERVSGDQYKLMIPNQEIRGLFISQIRRWFMEMTRADAGKLERFCRSFPDGDAATAERLLKDYLWDSISIRDTAVRKEMKENFYHGLLLGLLQYESDWEIVSNAEAGDGYPDISIRTPERVGIVIEIKYAESGDLIKGCAEALEQIDKNKYDRISSREGMEKIVRYGIAFFKKDCQVMAR